MWFRWLNPLYGVVFSLCLPKKKICRFLSTYFTRLETPLLLDLGAANAPLSMALLELSNYPKKVLAIDMDEAMLKRGRQQAKAKDLDERLDFEKKNFSNIDPSTHLSATVMLLSMVLHQVQDKQALLEQLVDGMTENQRLLVLDLTAGTKGFARLWIPLLFRLPRFRTARAMWLASPLENLAGKHEVRKVRDFGSAFGKLRLWEINKRSLLESLSTPR